MSHPGTFKIGKTFLDYLLILNIFIYYYTILILSPFYLFFDNFIHAYKCILVTHAHYPLICPTPQLSF